uniref:phage tail tip domain-containing protein n=1 Tax=Escherichia coli TaxID=562 RepID=UPI003CC81E6D
CVVVRISPFIRWPNLVCHYSLIVKKNGAEIYNRTALDNTLIYSGVIDMPAGHGHMTLEFSVSAWLVNDWYPTASISDLLVVVMKKATAGISIS